ncbi:MAG TPA: hypothetical protein VL551_10540 [Actinospica sp.]|jgi:hypothetical protein|nr:hypothetical protein [Actinospica sp.]
MTVTTIRVSHRVCLRDRTASEPAQFLTCPHARGRDGTGCFELIRRDDGVYGICTDHASRWTQHDRSTLLVGLRDSSPEVAAVLESPQRAQAWAVPQISVDLFDRLAARGTPAYSGDTRVNLPYVCVPEEVDVDLAPHLFEVGYVYATQDAVYDSLPAPEGGYLHPCPGCARRTGFVGSFDGHTLRVYCRCGTEREIWQGDDLRDSVIKGFSAADDGFTWFRSGNSRVEASVAQMRERGIRDGWYPETVTAQDEAVLDQAMRPARATTVLGAQAARAVAEPWLRALSVAEAISDALTANDELDRELRRLLRGPRTRGR